MNLTTPAHQRETDYLCAMAKAEGMHIPEKVDLDYNRHITKEGNDELQRMAYVANVEDKEYYGLRAKMNNKLGAVFQKHQLNAMANETLLAQAIKGLAAENAELKARVAVLENPKNETVNFADKKNAEDQIQKDLSVSKSLFGQIGRIKNTGLKVLAYIGYVLLSILTLGILPAVNFSTKPFQTFTGKKSGKVIDEKVEVRKQFDRKDEMLADLKKGVTLKKTNNEQENIRRDFERIARAKNAPLSKEAAKKVALVLVPSANPNAEIDVPQKLTKRQKLEKIAKSSDTRQALIAKKRLEKMNKEEAKAPAKAPAPAPAPKEGMSGL